MIYTFKNTKFGTLLYDQNEYTGISITKGEIGYFVCAEENSRYFQHFNPLEIGTMYQAKKYAVKHIQYAIEEINTNLATL